jgi:nucleotide-binding universal stress UspA family protein
MRKTNAFRTILCPVDFSGHSRRALRYAALLAQRNRGRLVAIFVEDPTLAAAAGLQYDERALLNKLRTQLRCLVERTAASYALAGAATAVDVVIGAPHREIVRAAERSQCDLIVIGSHGLTGARRMMLGSTTHRVLRDSPSPVLAIPPVTTRLAGPLRSWPGTLAIAPIDLASRSRADALAATTAARNLGMSVRLVHVIDRIRKVPWLDLDEARLGEQRRRQALAKLTKLKDELRWGVTDCVIVAGNPGDEIAKLASTTSVGLVIMTRRRGKGLFGPAQGSISYQVLTHSRTPVLAI